MAFADFRAAIRSDDLLQVADHWNAVRGTRRMPGWSDINPRAIARQLPIVWAYTYHSEANSFAGRLSGERIAEKFGKNFAGVPMRDIYPPKDYPRLFARAKRLVTEPALYRGEGLVFQHLENFGYGERIMMPLAANGETADGLLGATTYEAQRGFPPRGASETDYWFKLEA